MKTSAKTFCALLVGIAAFASTSCPAALVWDINQVHGSGTPAGSSPWATITLEDKGSTLELTIQSKLVPDSGNYFDKIGLSYTGPMIPMVSELDRSGTFKVDAVATTKNLPGAGHYNFVIEFDNANKWRFDGSDKVVYSINSPDLASFETLLNGNDWLIAAHVNGLGEGNALSSTIVSVPVPEPATILAGALLLLPFAASSVRRFVR